MKLGIDTGGTFTDFVLLTEEGLQTHKVPSTPADPAKAILAGIRHFFPQLPVALEVIHGSTVGTNAFLERKGARTVLVTTRGFEDLLFIGRQNRPLLYDFDVCRPEPIISRQQVIGVRERIRYDGTVQLPLGKTIGRRLRAFCRQAAAESVAVCLLHSYANSDHERQIRQALEPLGIPITLSSDILPEFREYERLTTTMINAYLAPVVGNYINRLASTLAPVPLSIQQSNGGILPAAGIAGRAINTVLSGPAGGVHGAFQVAGVFGCERIITFDMGGTSTDVSLCDQTPSLTRDYQIDGYPVRIPVLDIHTVGAGGGSIAWIDAGGLLRVGPESAGADPGPVCYGSGEQLTVTDANLYLGRLRPDRFMAGSIPLDLNRVVGKMNELATEVGLSPDETALGIITLVNTSMSKAVRAVSVERGHDPEDFVLFGFGGAAGLHCCELAAELGIKKIVIPARAGILSAQGMVYAEPVLDSLRSLFLRGDELEKTLLDRHFEELAAGGMKQARQICRLGPEAVFRVERILNLRYQGQSYELAVAYDSDYTEAFHQKHQLHFGSRMDDIPLELVSIQCQVRVLETTPVLPVASQSAGNPPAVSDMVEIMLPAGMARVPMYDRAGLLPGHQLAGPLLIIDNYTTVLLLAGFELTVDKLLNLVLVHHGEAG